VRIVAIAWLALLAGCNHFTSVKYASFDQACAMSAPTESAQVPVIRELDLTPEFPAMVLFAHINGDFHGGDESSMAYAIRSAAWSRQMRPDLIVLRPQGAAYAGSMTQYLGFGMAMSTPVTRPQATGFCMRLLPATIGCKRDNSGMIVDLTDEARKSGLQEGDKIVSLGGHTMDSTGGGPSPWQVAAMKHSPGDELPVVWIRPGVGRMDGKLTLQPNGPLPHSLPSLVNWNVYGKREVAEPRPAQNENASPGDAWQGALPRRR
jgi:hypothetical protein